MSPLRCARPTLEGTIPGFLFTTPPTTRPGPQAPSSATQVPGLTPPNRSSKTHKSKTSSEILARPLAAAWTPRRRSPAQPSRWPHLPRVRAATQTKSQDPPLVPAEAASAAYLKTLPSTWHRVRPPLRLVCSRLEKTPCRRPAHCPPPAGVGVPGDSAHSRLLSLTRAMGAPESTQEAQPTSLALQLLWK